jgi:pimeloyl-ACP methyl ester carboxylesterase
MGIPSTPYNFTQLVDHFSTSQETFNQRYYQNLSSFGGPGSPVICIMGGEGGIPPEVGIFYPSVVLLAGRLHAAIIEPEHRFYGSSVPDAASRALLTPPQALADAAAFIEAKLVELRCSGRGGEPRCPVVTVGGSYPAWLAAMMRIRYPALVDMAYAASAPMAFYSQAVDQYAYYKVITESAEKASPGCAPAVRSVLAATLATADKALITARLNLCTPLPEYLAQGDGALLRDELSMVVMYSFANLNMANWPPPDTRLRAACDAIVAADGAKADAWTTLADFLAGYSSGVCTGSQS